MQFQVPQFIETEDKVVGPFSLRQFLYVGLAAGLSAILYFILQTWLFAIFAIILIGGALAISFVKVEGRPMINVLISAANFYWHPQTYVWKPDHPTIQAHKTPEKQGGFSLENVAAGMALHKKWQEVQTGTPPDTKKNSDKQFIEKKMSARYEIFRKQTGDRNAARRVDYR